MKLGQIIIIGRRRSSARIRRSVGDELKLGLEFFFNSFGELSRNATTNVIATRTREFDNSAKHTIETVAVKERTRDSLEIDKESFSDKTNAVLIVVAKVAKILSTESHEVVYNSVDGCVNMESIVGDRGGNNKLLKVLMKRNIIMNGGHLRPVVAERSRLAIDMVQRDVECSILVGIVWILRGTCI